MAYFLGRDVNVYINTETTTVDNSIGVTGAADTAMTLVEGATSGMTRVFAQHMHASNDHLSAAGTAQADITGVEIALATMDEDTPYIGQIQPGKVEIKKEYTVSLTRKKHNALWDVIYNGIGTNNARFGLGNGLSGFGTGLVNPKSIVNSTDSCYGYRVTVQFKTGTAGVGTAASNEETISLTNMCITSYTTTLNADGVQEETIELSSYQPMLLSKDGDTMNRTLITTAVF
tara:strand:- start:181 stop:873 length:693 start_codon:yes stop_codon:yes gene_type:complete